MSVNIVTKVSKSFLLENLKRNKEIHIKEYESAVEVYFQELTETLTSMLDDVGNKVFRQDSYFLNNDVPQNKSKMYDKYIGILENSLDDEIEMDQHMYSCFVDDEWDWVRHAKMVNSTYAMKSVR